MDAITIANIAFWKNYNKKSYIFVTYDHSHRDGVLLTILIKDSGQNGQSNGDDVTSKGEFGQGNREFVEE